MWNKLSMEQKVIVAVLGIVAIIAIFLTISNSNKQKQQAALQQQQAAQTPAAQQQQQVQYFNIGGFQNDQLGKVILGDKDGKTLYTFANDAKDVSNCADACATTWPPYVFADPKQFLVPPTIAESFSTFQRADGKGYQVSYQGKPLYYYSGDAAAGEAKGEGLNNGAWKVIDIQQAPAPTGGAATSPAPQQ